VLAEVTKRSGERRQLPSIKTALSAKRVELWHYMFPRFHQTPSRLQVSLRESRRIGSKPRCEHIASLGSIAEPMTTAGRVALWARLHQRLAKLANAEADERLWAGLQGMNAELAEGNKSLADAASRIAADAEAAPTINLALSVNHLSTIFPPAQQCGA
jgi:hypothetical protein